MTKAVVYQLIFLIFSNLTSLAEEPPKEVKSVFTVLLQAVEDNDVKTFHSVCNEKMKEALTEEKLDDVSAQLSEAMLMGYKPEYLGSLNKTGIKVYLWRLNFDVKGIPDMLAELSFTGDAEDKAAGFSIK